MTLVKAGQVRERERERERVRAGHNFSINLGHDVTVSLLEI